MGLLHHQHFRARTASSQSRRQARHTASDDHDIRVVVIVLVPVCIGLGRNLSQTSGFTDDRLEHVLPRGSGRHEGLVVEPRRQEARGIVVHHAHVELEARPVVLRGTGQTVKQLGRGDALVGFKALALPQIDQSVRLFRARGHNATRTVVFERPAHQHLVFAQKRCGQRVALIALHAFAVEGEVFRFRTVDQATAFCQTGAHS